MATNKGKEQFNAWIDPKVAKQPGDVFRDYRDLFPKQGGYAKAVEMILEAGSQVVRETCEKEVTKSKDKKL